MNSRSSVRHELPDIDSAVAWLRDHWNRGERQWPLRTHEHAIEPDSALGSPKMAARMLAFLSARAFDVEKPQPENEPCLHWGLPEGKSTFDCLGCNGLGVRTVIRTRYKHPMWRALSLLTKIEADRHPAPILVVLTIAGSGFQWQTAGVLLGQAPDTFEALTVMAIRKLRGRYAEWEVARVGWVDKSESQRAAESVDWTAA